MFRYRHRSARKTTEVLSAYQLQTRIAATTNDSKKREGWRLITWLSAWTKQCLATNLIERNLQVLTKKVFLKWLRDISWLRARPAMVKLHVGYWCAPERKHGFQRKKKETKWLMRLRSPHRELPFWPTSGFKWLPSGMIKTKKTKKLTLGEQLLCLAEGESGVLKLREEARLR